MKSCEYMYCPGEDKIAHVTIMPGFMASPRLQMSPSGAIRDAISEGASKHAYVTNDNKESRQVREF